MALIGQPKEYRDRQVDLSLMGGFRPGRRVPVDLHLVTATDNGSLIAGVQKLAQRFLLELLTEVGSIRHLPGRGCRFMVEGRHGRWRTPADVSSSFYASLLDVRRNLLREETGSEPPDERFDRAVLESVFLARDRVALRIRVISQAGTDLQLIYPIRHTVVDLRPSERNL